MVFSSLTFLFFFLPGTLAVNFLLPHAARNYWLLGASLFFYAWGAHKFVFVLIASIIMNYVFARLIDRGKFAKFWLILAIVGNLGILFYNKYMNFFTRNLRYLFGDSITVTKIILPIGISFFTFQALSYVIDVYRKETPVQKNPYYLGLYIAFFPQLIAGPIVRYHTIAEQIENRTVTLEKFSEGAYRLCCGLAMKVLIANNMAIIADAAFKPEQNLSIGFAWLGAIAYTLQIFFDFGGYSSMAIGLGKMFGFDFQENFNYPYISKTITEFWRRWHISLGGWFRDYVYFPMGGSRVDGKGKLIRNLFVVWLLTGIWHGANWTFIVWGLAYFVLLTFEKLKGIKGGNFYRIFTLLCVTLGWVIFRSADLSSATGYISAMFGLGSVGLYDNNFIRYANDYKILLVIALVFCTPLFEKLETKLPTVRIAYVLFALATLVISVSSLVMGGHNPFIYFNF